VLEPVEPILGQLAVACYPLVRLVQRRDAQAGWAPLRFTAASYQSGLLEHFDVLGDRLEAHRERLSQLVDRLLTVCQPGEDCSPRRVGQCGECSVQLLVAVRNKPLS